VRRLPLFWRVGLAEVALVAVAAVVVTLVGESLLRGAARSEAQQLVQRRVNALAERLGAEGSDADGLQALASAEALGLWIERPGGATLGTPPAATTPGVPVASATAALPDGSRLGASLPLSDLPARLRRWRLAVAAGAAALAAALLGVNVLAFRRVERALAYLAARASGTEAEVSGVSHDAERLLASTEGTVSALRRQLATLTSRHDQLQAVLASMVEGVIVVDEEQRVLFLNDAGSELLAAPLERAGGRPLGELVRSRELQDLLEGAAVGSPSEGELALHGAAERSLQVHCARVVGADQEPLGSVLVLNDVTRLRRLERVRRDFVANVSHEIKTPITAIAGFVETLLDGGLADPEETRRFLRIVKRHADRLASLVEDLLVLARIEQEGEIGTVRTDDAAVADVLQAAAEACRFQADQRRIALVVQCEPSLRARVNAPLVEQALVNLIDNAVKYSPDGSAVTVAGRDDDGETVLSVADRGPGIAAADLPRLFERFYRVDRARSRQLGGTGLGLAIVKHVAQVHGGRAAVRSTLGQGSTFSLHLPRRSGAPDPASQPDASSPAG